MCKICEEAETEGIKVSKKIPENIRRHLLSNLIKYKYRFGISDDTDLKIKKSEYDDKRFALFVDNIKRADFGFAKKIGDRKYHPKTFIDIIDDSPKEAKSKQKLYKKRSSKITDADDIQTYMKVYSPNSLSYWLLWHCAMCH